MTCRAPSSPIMSELPRWMAVSPSASAARCWRPGESAASRSSRPMAPSARRSPACSTNFGGLGRDARIRYDTPVLEGLQFSTSYVDGGSYDAALRLGRSFDGGFRVIAAAAGAGATHRNHTPTTNLGYAGVPAGVTG